MTEHKKPHKTASSAKDVVYVDVEDDITALAEKVRGSSHSIVALVLPKRATMLQSIVNMKLLKRSAERAKKNIVLITTEAGLIPLAGAAGLYVAKSLQSKPEIPEVPGAAQPQEDDQAELADGADEASEKDAPVDKSKTVGELAQDDEPIELDNAEEAPEPEAAGKQKKPKGSKIKIPNFKKFRVLLLAGGVALVGLIALAAWAFIVLPKADVVISTDASSLVSSREITLDLSGDAELDAAAGVVPGKSAETTRTQRATVAATGEENQGDRATGSVRMTAQACAPSIQTPSDVPAGTGVSTGGNTYITQEAASFSISGGSGSCVNYESGPVDIIAQAGGEKFNTGNTDFSVAGRNVAARGSASGGTDDIVKVVTQQDIDKAKDEIRQKEAQDLESELSQDLANEGLFAIDATFQTRTGDTQTSTEAGSEAEEVTVTEDVTYSMLGASKSELEQVVAASVADEIDQDRQTILDYGLDNASFTFQNRQGDRATIGLRSVLVAGPDLDLDRIKDQIAGLKASEARSALEENPGVTDVQVSYGPFWVRSIPKNTSKINITVEEPSPPDNSNNNGQ